MFQRSGALPGSHLTDLGCPDCSGVLGVTEETDTGLVSFACRIGHRYSDQSLIPLKEDQLEVSLWTAVELYEELAQLHRELGERAERKGNHELATSYAQRAARAQANADAVRAIVTGDAPAALEPSPDEAGR